MAIKAVAMDVDGVLTDGTVGLSEGGSETKAVREVIDHLFRAAEGAR